MAFFSGAGDDGTTSTNNFSDVSKASRLAEAVGTVEELVAFLGVSVSAAKNKDITTHESGLTIAAVMSQAQTDLQKITEELKGQSDGVEATATQEMESVIDSIMEVLPDEAGRVRTGQSALAAKILLARAISRRAERRVVEANHVAGSDLVSAETLAFLNRISSLLQVLALRVDFASGFVNTSLEYEYD